MDMGFLAVTEPREKSTLVSNIFSGNMELLSNFSNYVGVMSAHPIGGKFVVQIISLDDEEFELKAPLDVIVTVVDGEYIVDLPSAEIFVSERSLVDAIAWLKNKLVGTYRRFSNEMASLGPGPRRQLSVLEGYIGKKSHT